MKEGNIENEVDGQSEVVVDAGVGAGQVALGATTRSLPGGVCRGCHDGHREDSSDLEWFV